jgi:hypothetical protein
MKHPALKFPILLVACALLSTPSIHSQEAPTRDKSSREASGVSGKPKGAIKIQPDKPREPVTVKETSKKAPPPEPHGVMILFEWIEVEHEDFSDWVFENKLEVDAAELRKVVQGWVKEDDAEIIRTSIIHARSGQRAQVESIEEVIYPTDYDPPEIPTTVTLEEAEAPVTPPNASAYQTRNVGTTVEVDPVISEDGQLIDLNLSPEMVFRLDDIEWASASNGERLVTKHPLFYTMKATTQVTLKNGGYALIGTLQLPPDEDDDDDENEEIVLLFVRADAS